MAENKLAKEITQITKKEVRINTMSDIFSLPDNSLKFTYILNINNLSGYSLKSISNKSVVFKI
jgi:hypothetical protein